MTGGNESFVLNYCAGWTWLMGTISQKNPFQVCARLGVGLCLD